MILFWVASSHFHLSISSYTERLIPASFIFLRIRMFSPSYLIRHFLYSLFLQFMFSLHTSFVFLYFLHFIVSSFFQVIIYFLYFLQFMCFSSPLTFRSLFISSCHSCAPFSPSLLIALMHQEPFQSSTCENSRCFPRGGAI